MPSVNQLWRHPAVAENSARPCAISADLRLHGVAFEIVQRRHRLVVEIEGMRIDQCRAAAWRRNYARQRFAAAPPRPDARPPRRRARPPARRATIAGGSRPASARAPASRTRAISSVEGIEREQRAAVLRRREQRREIAVLVAPRAPALSQWSIIRRASRHIDLNRPRSGRRRRGGFRRAGCCRSAPPPRSPWPRPIIASVAEALPQRLRHAPRIAARCRSETGRAPAARANTGASAASSMSAHARDRPGPDAVGQAQQRAAMRHAAEAEAAIAVGVDRRRPRQMRRIGAGRSWPFGLVASAFGRGQRVARRCRRRDRSGSARR